MGIEMEIVQSNVAVFREFRDSWWMHGQTRSGYPWQSIYTTQTDMRSMFAQNKIFALFSGN